MNGGCHLLKWETSGEDQVWRVSGEQGLLLDVLSMRTALLDSPTEILYKQLKTEVEIQGRVDFRDIKLRGVRVEMVFESRSTG